MRNYNESYFGRVFVAFSQLGNAISGGNPDITISARIGQKQGQTLYWRIVEAIVDFTFYPIDGSDHCYESYLKDGNEEYNVGGKGGLIIMTGIMALCCSMIIPFTWCYLLIKKGLICR